MEELRALRLKALYALRGHKDGPVNELLMSCSLTSREAAQARALEFQRFVDPGLHPRMTRAQRQEATRLAVGNRTILRLAKFWRAMEALLAANGPEASGWVFLEVVQTDEGPVRMLRLRRRKPITKGWRVPTLVMDATMRPGLLAPYWPSLELVADIAVEAPYQRVRQVVDRSYSLNALEQTDEHGDEDARRRHRNLRRVHAIICREARRFHNYPHKVLVVCQERVKLALADFGPLPPNVDLAHHNSIAGKDIWRDTPLVIVIGRTAPGPRDVEAIASALTGAACPSVGVGKWFDRVDAVRETVAGEWPDQVFGAVPAEADRHPDPVAEAVRWTINEGELVQIIGRPRGVNRSADNPVEILALADPVLPVPVSELLSASDLEPDPRDLMLAAGGVAFENPTDAAAAYPSLWATRNTAKSALQRQRLGANPNKYLLIGVCTQPLPGGLRRVEYQVAGPGRSPAAALYDPAVVPDPADWLAERLGPLAWCRVGDQPEPPDPPSSKAAGHEQPEPPLRTPRPQAPAAPTRRPRSWRTVRRPVLTS